MKLDTRLSTYFLTALALVLLGFSSVLFLLVYRHLVDRTYQRLEAAMQTLVAAIEVHPHDVEWEPLERHVTLGDDPGDDQARWMVHDPSGHLVDCSATWSPPPSTNPRLPRLSERGGTSSSAESELGTSTRKWWPKETPHRAAIRARALLPINCPARCNWLPIALIMEPH